MKISTTITKKFFKMKIKDLKESGFFFEYKEDKPFWKKRLDKDFTDCDMVFLVGKEPHRFKVEDVMHVHHDLVPFKYASAVRSEFVYAIKCVPVESEIN